MRISLNIPASRATLTAALKGLTAVNAVYLARHPRTPALYESGVRYRAEPKGSEKWLTIPQGLRKKFLDCEDLAAWRASELQRLGINAQALVIRSGPKTFHAVVRWPDGRIEDPSRRLGMKGRRKK